MALGSIEPLGPSGFAHGRLQILRQTAKESRAILLIFDFTAMIYCAYLFVMTLYSTAIEQHILTGIILSS